MAATILCQVTEYWLNCVISTKCDEVNMMKAINKKLNSFNLYLFCVYLTKAKNTTHGRLLWVCVCPQSISLLCGYAMTEVICRESLHFSGYWLAYWYTQHSVCFCSEAGMRAGACLRGRDYLSPKARKSRFKNRTESPP